MTWRGPNAVSQMPNCAGSREIGIIVTVTRPSEVMIMAEYTENGSYRTASIPLVGGVYWRLSRSQSRGREGVVSFSIIARGNSAICGGEVTCRRRV